MTTNPEIPKRLHVHYHKVANDEIVKLIFNYGKNKEGKGMQIPEWMVTEEMKQTQMYVSVFGVDVPTTQSQPTKSTQETHRTFSPLGHLTLLLIKVQEHLVDAKIETMMKGTQNVDEDEDEFMDEIFNDQEDPDTRLEPRSYKESPKVKKSVDVFIINDGDDEEESARDEFILKKEKGNEIEEIRDTPPPTPIRYPRTHIAPLSSDKETIQELTAALLHLHHLHLQLLCQNPSKSFQALQECFS
nr:hypothetical protein [Tanacetum cinerariifolium]GFA10049.1 hypothetical protein [Tanacetum cinerariifolium]